MIKRGTCMLVTGLLASLVLAGCAGPTSGTISTLQMEDEVILDTDSVVPSTKASSAAVSAEEATEEAGQKEESTESVISESTSSDTHSTISENAETLSSESAPEITETPAPTPEVTETPTPTPTPTATPTPTPEPTPTPDPDEGMLVIGSRAEDSSWRVPVKNEVFSDIVYLSIKNADDPEYPGNFLPEGQRLKDQSEGILYFTYKDPTAYYNVKVQFDDGSYHYMTAVPFADMENARILYEDKILFMIYESKETGEELSTKDTELDWIIAKLGTE